jgi:hypothetical protein
MKWGIRCLKRDGSQNQVWYGHRTGGTFWDDPQRVDHTIAELRRLYDHKWIYRREPYSGRDGL